MCLIFKFTFNFISLYAVFQLIFRLNLFIIKNILLNLLKKSFLKTYFQKYKLYQYVC